MPTVPDSTKTSLQQRLSERARDRWPALDHISVRHRAGFAYPNGAFAGTAENALDCACGLCLNDPSAWT